MCSVIFFLAEGEQVALQDLQAKLDMCAEYCQRRLLCNEHVVWDMPKGSMTIPANQAGRFLAIHVEV